MTISNGAQHSLHLVTESKYDTTPSSPTCTPILHTGTTLGITKDGIESEKLRGDRQIEDFRHGNKSVSGEITSELEYGAFDDLLEAAFCGSWAANVLKTGTTRRSFTIEREFNDLATVEYHRHTGSEINSVALSVAPNSMVNATFGIIGKDLSLNTSQVGSSTYSADGNKTPFDSFTGSITEGGSAIATVTALEFSLENGIEPLFAVGSATTQRPAIGKSRLTGTLTTYFESKALYEKFLNETSSAIVLTLTDVAGNDYIIEIGNVKYNSGQPDVSGEGAITIAMDFVGLYDTSDASNIKVTRTPA